MKNGFNFLFLIRCLNKPLGIIKTPSYSTCVFKRSVGVCFLNIDQLCGHVEHKPALCLLQVRLLGKKGNWTIITALCDTECLISVTQEGRLFIKTLRFLSRSSPDIRSPHWLKKVLASLIHTALPAGRHKAARGALNLVAHARQETAWWQRAQRAEQTVGGGVRHHDGGKSKA